MKKNKNPITKDFVGQLGSYLIVGAGATIVEWTVFRVLNFNLDINYAVATTIAFCVSTLANWILGRIITFRHVVITKLKEELLKIYGTSVIGLILNLIIMFLLVSGLHVNAFLSKVAATGIVFFWNFFVRKLYIYKNK